MSGTNVPAAKIMSARSALAVIPLLPRSPLPCFKGLQERRWLAQADHQYFCSIMEGCGTIAARKRERAWGSAQRKMYGNKQKWHSRDVFMVRGWPIGRPHLCRSCRVIDGVDYTTMDGTACSNEASGTRSGWIQSHAGGWRSKFLSSGTPDIDIGTEKEASIVKVGGDQMDAMGWPSAGVSPEK